MRRLIPLLLLLAGCAGPVPDAGPTVLGAEHGAATAAIEAGLVYFTAEVDGDRSTLWLADPAADTDDDGLVARRRLASVEHAAGYLPRGVISVDGEHTAWVTLPSDRRHGDPAELHVDGVLVDELALYLQTPRLLEEQVLYLRSWAGEPRTRADGKLLPRLDSFEIVALDAAAIARGEPRGERVVSELTALWVQLCGVLPGPASDPEPGLLALVLTDAGPELVELRTDGRLRARWRLHGSEVRDVQVDPAGGRDVYVLAVTPGTDDASLVRVPFGAPGSPTTVVSGLHRASSPRLLADGSVVTTTGLVGGPGPPKGRPASACPAGPCESAWRAPEHAVPSGGTLWREHSDRAPVAWVLERSPEDRVFLAPPGHDLAWLGAVR